jgi:very-short-patch-repair endonuclease
MPHDRNQRDFARNLRKNSTVAERSLWSILRCEQFKGYKFRRQAAIGDYVVDFVCFSNDLVIELDGGQHNEELAKRYDLLRTAWLESQGFRVLRYWNHEVFENLDGIVEVIWRALSEAEQRQGVKAPSPALPTRGREQE